jgi:hypothetical protein
MDRPSFTFNSDRATTGNRAAATACELEAQDWARWDLSEPGQMRCVFVGLVNFRPLLGF